MRARCYLRADLNIIQSSGEDPDSTTLAPDGPKSFGGVISISRMLTTAFVGRTIFRIVETVFINFIFLYRRRKMQEREGRGRSVQIFHKEFDVHIFLNFQSVPLRWTYGYGGHSDSKSAFLCSSVKTTMERTDP